MNEAVELSKLTTEGALELFQYGAIGVMFVFSLVLNVVLGTLLYTNRTKQINHAEKHHAKY